jgi:hypothetical protein
MGACRPRKIDDPYGEHDGGGEGFDFFFGGRTLLRHLRVRSQAQGPATRYRG